MARKVLLAEDSLTIQKVFEITLAKSSTSLTIVDNGAEAVRIAEELAPDLVVADVSLPEKDGYQVASEIKSSEHGRSCPVLVLSGSVTPFDEVKFKASGANGVLFKPFESQQLIDKIEEMLRGREPVPAAGKAAPAPGEAQVGREEREGKEEREEKEEHPPGGSEPWDFSDVLEEVEAEVGVKPAPHAAAPSRGEDLLPGGTPIPPDAAKESLSLGEFDVSLDEVEEAPADAKPPVTTRIPPPVETQELSPPPAKAPPPPADREPSAPPAAEIPLAAHLEGDLVGDAPPAVTDIGPAIDDAFLAAEELEEIEEIEHLDAAGMPEDRPAAAAVPPPPAMAAVPAGGAPVAGVGDAFSARAREIFERVAAETVEKAVWEFMDRFARDYSEKLRESAEAVAWEVIPSTAEAIIREEVARIRAQAGKKPS